MLSTLESNIIIECKNVSLQYGDTPYIFQDISLSLKKASFHFITGMSGAGKTSLLKLFYCEQLPSLGHVKIFDQDTRFIHTKRLPLFSQKMGLVFQNFSLFNHLTVL